MAVMRRFIALSLLLLLPLQFSTASAAGYCSSAADDGAHLGHHEHSDAPRLSTPTEDADMDVPGGWESHCGICHLNCAQAHPSVMPVTPTPVALLSPPLADDPAPDHPQEPSERPPRVALA